MPLRFVCPRITLTPGGVLHAHFGHTGFYRPIIDVYLAGPGGMVGWAQAQIDSASDYTIFSANVAHNFGLSLPFPTQATSSGAAGALASTYSFPPAGLVSLFVTDYNEFCYLPAPLLGFHPPRPLQQRSVLGLAGFLEHFLFTLDHGPHPPVFELDSLPGFPGQAGPLPKGGGLLDFIRGLRAAG